MAIKSCDSTCYPLCVACHRGIGSEGWFTKEKRRELESIYTQKTRTLARSLKAYPEGW